MSNNDQSKITPENQPTRDNYNLTIIQQNATNADCLSPTAFIASTHYPVILKAITGALQPSFSITKDKRTSSYHTRYKPLFLAYIRHCFNNNTSEVVA